MRKPNVQMIAVLGWMLFNCAAMSAVSTSEIPTLITPAHNGHSVYPFPNFNWTDHPAAFEDVGKPIRYKIQIAADKDFRPTIDTDIVYLNRYVHNRPLDPGTYYWRVCAVTYEGLQGPWSRSRSFTITPYDDEVMIKPVNGSNDQTLHIQQRIKKAAEIAKQGRSVIIRFAPGDYHIGRSFRGPLIGLAGVSNISLDGTGARIHFTNRKQGLIRAVQCQNIAIMNFSSSFAKGSLRVHGYVKAVDLENRIVTVSIEPGFPNFTDSDSQDRDIFYLLEPNTDGRLKTDTANHFSAVGGFTENEDNTWSFKLTRTRSVNQLKVGDRYCLNFRQGSANLVDFSRSTSVTAYGLKNSGWGNMQYVSVEGSLFNILNSSTPLEDGEWMTGNADGVHIRGHKIGPWIENIQVQAIGDDAVALYARPASIAYTVSGSDESSKTLICRKEFFNLEPANEVSFFQPLTGAILLDTSVKSVLPVDAGYKVVFHDAVPTGLKYEGTLFEMTQIWNRSKSCGDFVVRNCEFTNIRRFGTVFRSKRGVVETNAYRGISTRGVVFINETQWPNGLYASDIIVRDNSFTDCGFDASRPRGAISFRFKGYGTPASTIGPRNILIDGNIMQDCSSPEIELSWTENAVVRNNLIRLSSGKLVPATVSTEHCSNIHIVKDEPRFSNNRSNVQMIDALEMGFESPPDGSKPHMWWHWMNGHVTAESITRELEDMKRIGINGFSLFNTHEGLPKGPVEYASEKWWQLLEHTMNEAERLGLEMSIKNGAGWSATGAAFVTPDKAMVLSRIFRTFVIGLSLAKGFPRACHPMGWKILSVYPAVTSCFSNCSRFNSLSRSMFI